jgi:hypothetical protein
MGYTNILHAPDYHGGLGTDYQKGVGTDHSRWDSVSVTLAASGSSPWVGWAEGMESGALICAASAALSSTTIDKTKVRCGPASPDAVKCGAMR